MDTQQRRRSEPGRRVRSSEGLAGTHNAGEPLPHADAGPVERPVRPPLQGGLSNAELLTAWMRKLPRVEPSERDLTAFALGVEVGREIGLQAAAQAAQPDDSYQDEWFKAKADAVRRIRALLPPAA